LVLNMASEHMPGGGYWRGKSAQEEQLFYRTTLCVDLGPSRPVESWKHRAGASPPHPYDPNRKWRYPLKDTQLIHTPAAAVLRASEADEYQMLKPDDRYVASFVSVAAIRNPALDKGGRDYAKDSDRALMRQKIDAIFRLAVQHKYDSLVLGALGCGAFHNPAPAVAAMFRDALDRHAHRFKGVVFAVYDPHPSSADSNFDTFHSTIIG
jgi:uncharacterized protein (TIGR02452 family)